MLILVMLILVMLTAVLTTPVLLTIARTKPAWCCVLKALTFENPFNSIAADIVNVSSVFPLLFVSEAVAFVWYA